MCALDGEFCLISLKTLLVVVNTAVFAFKAYCLYLFQLHHYPLSNLQLADFIVEAVVVVLIFFFISLGACLGSRCCLSIGMVFLTIHLILILRRFVLAYLAKTDDWLKREFIFDYFNLGGEALIWYLAISYFIQINLECCEDYPRYVPYYPYPHYPPIPTYPPMCYNHAVAYDYVSRCNNCRRAHPCSCSY